MKRLLHTLRLPIAVGMILLTRPDFAHAANQTSATYRVAADVFCSASPPLAAGSAIHQVSLSVWQYSVVNTQAGPSFLIQEGFQAGAEGFDTDCDGIPDNVSADADGDGIPNALDPRPYDTDNDGLNNISADDDDDADGLDDIIESTIGTSRARADTDGDTHNDYAEYIVTGTSPTDKNDHLRFLQVNRDGTNAALTWASVPGKTNYWVQRSLSLTNLSGWTTILGPVTAGGYSTSITDSNSPQTNSCYRIRIPY